MSRQLNEIDPSKPQVPIQTFNEIVKQARILQSSLPSQSYLSSIGLLTRGRKTKNADIRIFEVQSAATGDGVYNCYEQIIVNADWEGTGGEAKIWDKEAEPVAVEVLNLAEHNPSAGQHNLVEGDILAAWQATDDEGTKRWVGVPAEPGTGIHRAFCKTDAPASTQIVCYLDEDEYGEEITVNCDIAGGGNLNAAMPRLTDGFPLDIYKKGDDWFCISKFQALDETKGLEISDGKLVIKLDETKGLEISDSKLAVKLDTTELEFEDGGISTKLAEE